MDRLLQVVQFADVAGGGGTAQLAHQINVNGVQRVPDFVAMSAGGFTVVVTSTTVTVTNGNDDVASVDVWLELKHSITRVLGSVQATGLTPRPFVAAGGGSGGSIPDPLVVDNLTVHETAVINGVLDVATADGSLHMLTVDVDELTVGVPAVVNGDFTVVGEIATLPGFSANEDRVVLNDPAVYLAPSGGGADPMDGNVVVDLPASQGLVVQDPNGNRVFRAYGGAAFGEMAISFFNGDLAAKPTGVAVTAEAIHAALVTLGLISG